MTSRASVSSRRLRSSATARKAAIPKRTMSSRDISPPPAKRRKTATEATIPMQTFPAAAAALPALGPNSMRIFSWNINGITPFLQKPITYFFQVSESKTNEALGAQDTKPPASLRGFLQRHNWPTMLLLQEAKIATKDKKTQDVVRVAVNSQLPSELSSDTKGPKYEAHFTLPNDAYNARGLRGSGKVYGVCSIFRSDLRNNYAISTRTVDWDKEGRVSVVEIIANAAKLAVFNIYAVNGTENPYRDPVSGAVRGNRHDRKLKFHRLLMQECMELEGEGWDVILAGDMNIAPDARDGHPKLRTYPHQHVLNRADFHSKLLEGDKEKSKGFNGVDVWRKMHGDERRYTYFPRGKEWNTSCDRVDYFIVGRGAWDKGCIKACGILDSEVEREPSDHVPIWMDLGFEKEGITETNA